MTDSEFPVLLEYSIAGTSYEVYVPSTAAAADGAHVLIEVVITNEYLKHGIKLEPGSLVVDVGAHIGLFGVKALASVPNGDLTYVGIEPCICSFRSMSCNLLGPDGQGTEGTFFCHNKGYSCAVQASTADRDSLPYPKNILLINKAVSSKPGQQHITYFPNMPSNSTLHPSEKHQLQAAVTPAHYFANAQQQEIQVGTLSQILQEAGLTGREVSLLKIDVEGHELEVLKGLSQGTWNCVQQLVIEVHDVGDDPTTCHQKNTACSRAAVKQAAAAAGPQTEQESSSKEVPYAAAAGTLRGAELTATSTHDGALNDTQSASVLARKAQDAGTAADGSVCRASSGAVTAEPVLQITSGSCRPKPDGRVMHVVELLQVQGFSVAVKSAVGLPVNFVLYAIRPCCNDLRPLQ